MADTSNAANTGTSAGFLLFLLFLGLKLTGYISWSWWYVTAPLWAPLLFVVVIVLVIVVLKALR